MRDVFIKIEGLTPYSSSKHIVENLLKGEKKDDHEKRRWRPAPRRNAAHRNAPHRNATKDKYQ